jgi:hypothetical protein
LTVAQLCSTAVAATLAWEADEGFRGSEQVHPLADQGKALPQVFITHDLQEYRIKNQATTAGNF